MAIREIVMEGAPVLRKKAREAGEMTERTRMILDDMVETMRAANGVGLAAPQVGLSRRLIVIEYEDQVFRLADPVITMQSGAEEDLEGCLSCPGKAGYVIRPDHITVEATDYSGERSTLEIEGYLARIFCHEIDHLDGVLYIDKVTRMADPEGE